MRQTLVWLVTFRGTVTRGQYLGWGLLLMAAKMLLDALLCSSLLARPWSPLFYLSPVPWDLLRGGEGWRWLLLAAASLPFAWIGLALSVRRLRDAGLHPWYAVVFVWPFANLVLFALLVALPAERIAQPTRAVVELQSGAQAWMSVGMRPALIASLSTAGFVWLGIGVLAHYGGALFFGIPFLQGFLVGVTARRPTTRSAINQFFLSACFSMLLLLCFGFEGLVCIVMAAPLWIFMGVMGVVLGRALTKVDYRHARHLAPALLIVPVAQFVEPLVEPVSTVFAVTTEVAVNAPPALVWKSLVEFPELSGPTELPFRLGIAYPIRATIEGQGVGAVRRCTFSTGDFVEPIEVWDEPRMLRFSVLECPQPMVEWNPLHDHVDAAHLHGYFTSKRGQFELREQPDGTTVLAGTTWYSHGLWPEAYWAVWSDWLLHTIHRRVLLHIRDGAERLAGR